MSRPTPTFPRKPTRGSRPSAMNWLTTFCGSAAGCASAPFHQILLDVQYAAILHFGAAPCHPFFAGTSVTGRKPICVGCCAPSLAREALEECGAQENRGRRADKGGHLGVWVVRRHARPHETVRRWQAVEDIDARTFAIPLQQLHADWQSCLEGGAGLQATALEFSHRPSAYFTLSSNHQSGSASQGNGGYLCCGVEACGAAANDAEVVGL